MSIVRLYNCPYFINGECSLRSHDNPLIDFWNRNYIAKAIIPHCPKNRAYCHVDVDTDNWSGGVLNLIRTVVNGCRNGNSNAGETIDIIEQILERRNDMKDSSSEVLCISREWFEEKQAEARQEGREEAWDLARRIVTGGEDTYNLEDMHKLFGSYHLSDIFNLPPDEAIAKDKKHQEEQEKGALHVGDEVEFTAPGSHKFIEVYKGYVIRFDEESPRWVSILTKDGMYYRSTLMCTKTGKHNPDVEKVMASFEKGES